VRLLVIGSLALMLVACIPVPQRVQDEFSRYDGERPNNFLTGYERADREEAAQETAE